MGAWGIGLYSSDFAMDLRGCVNAVVRLPFDPDRLLETICQSEPSSANDVTDPDHTVFWLTVADQFAKKGIDCPTARDRALAIIADGADLATMASLGMDEKSLAKRRVMLEGLHARLTEPVAVKRRAVLKAPQKLLLEVGEVLTYPVCQQTHSCEPINPYAVGKEWAWVKAWKQDGWGAIVVAERGLLFDFLAWYRPLMAYRALQTEPNLAELAGPRAWKLRQSGTLTARHYANLQLKSIGRIDIDLTRLDYFFPDRRVPFGPVVGDISISGSFTCHPQEPDGAFWDMTGEAIKPGLRALADIEAGAEVSDAGNLCGSWRGEYSDDGDDDPPRSFVASLREVAGLVRGRIDEMATETDKPGRPLEAVVDGRRARRAVRLIKRYVSATKRYIPILYEGEVSEAGDRIEGRWSMRTGRAGRFAMTTPSAHC
jgi:hypothetical protein